MAQRRQRASPRPRLRSPNATVQSLRRLLKAARQQRKEALERQTATAKILGAISSSLTDTQPVFDIIAERAVALCGAEVSVVSRFDGASTQLAAIHGITREGVEALRKIYPVRLDAETATTRAFRTRSIVHLADVQTDPRYEQKGTAVAAGWRSALAVPMLRGAEVIGVIFVGRSTPGLFAESQVELLKTFADQAVIAIENARLFTELQMRTEALTKSVGQLTALGEVGQAISSTLNLETVLRTIVQRAVQLAGLDGGSIYEFDERDERFHLRAAEQVEEAILEMSRSSPIRLGEGALGRAGAMREAVVVEDVLDTSYQSRARELLIKAGSRALLVVPLLRESVLLGALVVYRKSPGPFASEAINLLKTFATQSAVAIQNARLFNETKEALEQQKASAEVLGTISSSIADTRPVFEKILESTERLFAGRVVGINVLGEDGMIHLGAYQGPGREAFEKVFPLPVDRHSGSGLAIAERRVVHIPDSEADGVPEAARRGNRARGNRASLYAPMMSRDEAIGVIWVSRELPGPFGEKEIALLKTFADQAVIAIENARLFKETNEALERQTATAEILKVISSSPTNVAPVFDAIAERARVLCGASLGYTTRFDGKLLHLVGYRGVSARAEAVMREMFPRNLDLGSINGRAILAGEPVQIVDVHLDPEYRLQVQATAAEFCSMLAVPMLRSGEPIGAVGVARKDPGAFSDRLVSLLKTFADQAVIAIENARLFNETREALERQTATAEILQVMSGSPTDTQPVFDAIAKSGVRLFQGVSVSVRLLRGGRNERVAFAAGPDSGVTNDTSSSS
ncbi:MAG TPA: GAF domain-containing protein, partial [Gemmatimonadaceae bacterium]|nr:GAF domain-containing protein [Gemmatimonadaceae bacterium]